ncbi:MAG: DUF5411 family protein [Bacilli bacterium]
MSKGILASGIIMLGVMTLALVNIIQNYSSGNELDFYLLRDTTEAAMLDAVDYGFYQVSGGEIRMDKEKFVESFVRRFAENVVNDRNYDIRFYDIKETPPKVSVKVGSSTSVVFSGESFQIKNQIDSIIESKYYEDRVVGEVEK